MFPFRVTFAVAVAAAVSLWGVIEHFGFEAEDQKQNRDPYRIAQQAERFEQVRSVVPEKAQLGYLTDLEPGSVAGSAAFNGAQYILAPRLLKQDTSPELALGNFARPADFAALGRGHGLGVERDFGNGVVLFRKEPVK